MAARTEPQTRVRTRLGERRVDAGWTQAQIAAAAGLSVASYRRLERGEVSNPTIGALVNCALTLGCELGDILEPEWLERHDLGPARP